MGKEKGVALIDALIAVFVISTGVVGTLDLITACMTEIDYQRKITMAGMLAASKLETLDAADAIPAAVGTPTSFAPEFGGLPEYNKYEYTLAVTPIVSAGHTAPVNLTGWSAKLVLTVNFKDLNSKPHKLITTGIKTKRL